MIDNGEGCSRFEYLIGKSQCAHGALLIDSQLLVYLSAFHVSCLTHGKDDFRCTFHIEYALSFTGNLLHNRSHEFMFGRERQFCQCCGLQSDGAIVVALAV